MESSPVIGTGLVHRWGDVHALRGVDVRLERGKLTVLLGPNGSGKSTLLRLLAGHLAPSAGELVLFGQVLRPGARSLDDALRRRIGYVSQHAALDPEMTAEEILNLFCGLFGVPRSRRQARGDELLKAYGLESLRRRRVFTFSGGQRRRLHLAAGLLHDPELILLDEPTAGLDTEGRDFLRSDLQSRLEKGCTVAVITHDPQSATGLAHEAWRLEDGRIIERGEPSRVLESEPIDQEREREAGSGQGRGEGRGQGRGRGRGQGRGQGPRDGQGGGGGSGRGGSGNRGRGSRR